jgi:hypothetical protein
VPTENLPLSVCRFCFTARLTHFTKDVYYSSNYNGDDDDDDDDNNNNNNINNESKLQNCQSPPTITCGYRLPVYEELLQIREKNI